MFSALKHSAHHAGPALLCVSVLALAACSDNSFDPNTQIGANPNLPEPRQYLFPPVHTASVVGWKKGETPSVASDLRIEALATGLEHPPSLYVLPNGDVLVVESKSPGTEPIKRPKDLVMHWIEAQATSGGEPGKSNRITLLRDANGDGVAETRAVFLDNLNSPFGVALVGSDLYVADTDAIVRYPYNAGDTKITAAGTVLTSLPGPPLTITGPKAWWPARTARSCTWAWDRTATSRKGGCKRRRIARPSGKWIVPRAAGGFSRAGCGTRMV